MPLAPFILLSLAGCCAAGRVLYDGRIPLNYTEAMLDADAPPFTT
jgi:hypothetical protein